MDYVEHDLKSLMETMRKKKQSFTIGEVKTLMIQLLRAVHHLHDNWILHRDLKTSNLLLSSRGILKVNIYTHEILLLLSLFTLFCNNLKIYYQQIFICMKNIFFHEINLK